VIAGQTELWSVDVMGFYGQDADVIAAIAEGGRIADVIEFYLARMLIAG
jgi:hypothetical protein